MAGVAVSSSTGAGALAAQAATLAAAGYVGAVTGSGTLVAGSGVLHGYQYADAPRLLTIRGESRIYLIRAEDRELSIQ